MSEMDKLIGELLADAVNFNLFNDLLAQVVFSDKLACQHVLRILLGDDRLTVKEVKTQNRISQTAAHDIIMDVLAEDESGRLFGVEIQREDDCDHARRVRYYGAMVDCRYLPKGKDYADLRDLCIIYISEADIWRKGKTVYSIEKRVKETGDGYDDGLRVMYVNAEVDDGSLVAVLMRYFLTARVDDMSQGELSRWVKHVKLDEGRRHIMGSYTQKIMDIGIEKGIEKGREEERRVGIIRSVRNLMASLGMTLEKSMDALKVSGDDREMCRTLLATA